MNDIPISREIRLMLLGWLKNGIIPFDELESLNPIHKMSVEELEKELDRIAKFDPESECARLKRIGYCKNCDR
ncbi:MAG: hypothetical protein LIP09_07365 [Bacteroidales bacterium]|nr:hypothetical protein [Bacteroidales bacterium]